ncbi:uncharacterized protein MCYG_07290 [Microsporum canis CBS 113480]|uniref:Uncharacterized protein n=1 Tax=Arthroderma otae (strain ATCC MYA-4605 / CBS 113480) TaxID=554155 RepID=C5FY73_ARTOC|nr:uncharacterized protein MCYG_07290 [Microsporum canis CBS 113480]EEQ34471.1 predicted protein [Microsporum canis CBS 113480]
MKVALVFIFNIQRHFSRIHKSSTQRTVGQFTLLPVIYIRRPSGIEKYPSIYYLYNISASYLRASHRKGKKTRLIKQIRRPPLTFYYLDQLIAKWYAYCSNYAIINLFLIEIFRLHRLPNSEGRTRDLPKKKPPNQSLLYLWAGLVRDITISHPWDYTPLSSPITALHLREEDVFYGISANYLGTATVLLLFVLCGGIFFELARVIPEIWGYFSRFITQWTS